MSGSYAGNRRPRAGGPGAGLWSAMEQLRSGFERRGSAPRPAGDDVRAAVLTVLTEAPMHGSQIIRAIEDRSGGARRPSPGSVYPTLQLLADEGLVTAEESAGRKTYSLTETGRAAATMAAAAERSAPWDAPRMRTAGRPTALPKAGAQLAQAAAQVVQTGSPEQIAAGVAVLDEARRKLYAILAES